MSLTVICLTCVYFFCSDVRYEKRHLTKQHGLNVTYEPDQYQEDFNSDDFVTLESAHARREEDFVFGA